MTFLSMPYLLENKIQPYEWGERGPQAFIPQLLGLDGVGGNKPFAELWIGAHPLGASQVRYAGTPTPLPELVARYPQEILGERVARLFGRRFPFLLKVLSANEPLSIQLHPSKEQAALLHGKDPAHYPDDNHKPEVAIVLESLHALAGLRHPRQIESVFKRYPEIREFVEFRTYANRPKRKYPLLAFQALMRRAVEQPGGLARVIEQLEQRLRRTRRPGYRQKLFLELTGKYPGDVGLVAIFFLKLFMLKKGQALFIPAGIPHAYLKGNIVECMASSDNVVRAGLTPKFKDIPALLEIANDKRPVLYRPESADYVYATPAREFRVAKRELAAGQAIRDASGELRVLLALRGRLRLSWPGGGMLDVTRGQSVLLPAGLGEVGIECREAAEIYTVDVP